MRKILGLLALSAGVLFTGCTTDPAAQNITNIYGDSAGIVSSDSIQYHEIHIDAFSHYWASQKLWRTSLGGDTLLAVDSSASPDILYYDTLILLDGSLDKTAGLPAHTIGLDYESRPRLIYSAVKEPKTFSCYLYRKGTHSVWDVNPPSGDTTAFIRNAQVSVSSQEIASGESNYFFWLQNFPLTIERLDCGYFPGKGFYFGYSDYDYFGRDISTVSPGAEIVIRY